MIFHKLRIYVMHQTSKNAHIGTIPDFDKWVIDCGVMVGLTLPISSSYNIHVVEKTVLYEP